MEKRSAKFIWILLSVLMQTAAAVFAKKAALVSYGSDLLAIVLNRWYMLELVALACQAFSWAMALRSFSLFVAYSFASLVYGLYLLPAWLIFNESISTHHVVGVGIIITGVILISSAKKS